MFTGQDGGTGALSRVISNADADNQFALEGLIRRQGDEHSAGSTRVDAFELFIEVMHVEQVNFIRWPGGVRQAANFCLIEQVVALVNNDSMRSHIRVTKPGLQTKRRVAFRRTITLSENFSSQLQLRLRLRGERARQD